MDGFSAKGAVMAGLTLMRRRPGLISVWVAVDLVRAILMAGAIQLQIGASQANMAATLLGRPTKVEMPLMLMGLDIVFICISAVVWTSAFRAFLRPADHPPLGLALSRDEWFVLWARIIPQAILAVLALMLLPLRMRGLSPQWSPLMDGLLVVLTIGAAFWSAVTGVWAFDRLQIAPLRSWRLARGYFWKLTAVFVACALIVRAARWGLMSVAVLLNHHTPLYGRMPLVAMGSPPVLFLTAGSAVISALEIALLAGVVATAYRSYCAQGVTSAPSVEPGGLAGA